MTERTIVTLTAKDKKEAIAALELLTDVIKDIESEGPFEESVIVTSEGTCKSQN